MSIMAVRIDNRLLHGIVATQWAPLYEAQRVMIIDDHTADNPVLKDSMKMSKPAGKALSIINCATAYENFKNKKYDGHGVFIIVKNPQIALDLINLGEKIPELVIGGTVEPEGEDYFRVSKRACVTMEEKKIYDKILEAGTEITVQYVPRDKAVLYKTLI